MWETVRDMTLKSQAPTLVYEEGSLIKRSLRDLYNKEIDEIQVAGNAGYDEARDFMKMLMPSNVRAVKQYRDGQPLFSRMGVESQLDAMFSPTVQLRSGGYIVINQTEALVSIDVNSGRSTREHHIEDTALKTNLEAAEEVARQLRLRDLAGLIVIDFIDMDEKRNNRSVERKLSDCLRQDRARIQVGRISHFGLLEMSRQRIRASVLESSTEPCAQCGGSGHVRSVSSVALQLLRGIEEVLMKGATHNLVVRTRTDVALYVLNHKRGHLRDLENSFKVSLAVSADASVSGLQSFIIDRGEQVHTLEAAKALLAAQAAAAPPQVEEALDDEEFDLEAEAEVETEETEGLTEEAVGRRRKPTAMASAASGAGDGAAVAAKPARAARRAMKPKSSAPRCRRQPEVGAADDGESAEEKSEEQPGFARGDGQQNGERRPRRRGRRGGRRRRGSGPEDGLAGSISDELAPPPAYEAESAVADFDGVSEPAADASSSPNPAAASSEPQPAEPVRPEPVAASAPEETAAEAEKSRAAAFDRARKGQLPVERTARYRARDGQQPSSRRRPPGPCACGNGTWRIGSERSAAQGRLVVATLRRRVVLIPTNKNRPAKPGGFFFARALGQPARDARDRLAHVVGRARIGKADEGAAMDRIEIDAGGCRDMRLLQHLIGKGKAVGSKIRHIGIEVERAIRRQEFFQTGARKTFDQDVAVLLIAALDRFHLLAAFEGGFGCDLRQRRHRDREILLQPLDRPHQRFRHHHPADPPAGHAKIFRERIDDECIGRKPGRRHRGERVIEPVIDFVGDEADAGALGGMDQAGQCLARHHGAGRIGGTADQHALQRRLAMRRQQGLAGQRMARVARGLDQHRLAAERGEDVAVRRIARHGHRDPIAGLEHRKERQDERARRARGDHDPRRIDMTAISIAVMSRDPFPQ